MTNVTEPQNQASDQEIEAKILHLLNIYPVISPTMLQSGLGPYTKPALWRPVLARLVEEGKIVESQESLQTPSERYNSYSKLSLPGVTVNVPVSVNGG